jgi:hypothetical protein
VSLDLSVSQTQHQRVLLHQSQRVLRPQRVLLLSVVLGLILSVSLDLSVSSDSASETGNNKGLGTTRDWSHQETVNNERLGTTRDWEQQGTGPIKRLVHKKLVPSRDRVCVSLSAAQLCPSNVTNEIPRQERLMHIYF